MKYFLADGRNISFVLPELIVQEIRGIPLALNSVREDILIGAFSKDGNFSLRSAYLLAKGLNPLNLATPKMWVWKSKTTPRIKFFLWLCYHGSIPTKDVLSSRGFNLDTACDLCSCNSETIIHLLRDCGVARNVWRNLGINDTNQDFFNSSLAEWLKKNCESSPFFARPRIPWSFIFPQAVWLIWLHQNNYVFRTKRIQESIHLQCIKKGAEYYAVALDLSNKPPRTQIQVKWIKPNPGWVKLNTDGVVSGAPGKAGKGGVLRCSRGLWVAGFARKLGAVSSSMAELWALKDGLLLAKQLNFQNINIELDAEFIVHLLFDPNSVNLMLEPS